MPLTLLDLPEAVLAKIVALFADGSRRMASPQAVRGICNLAAVARSCSQLAQIVEDPTVYVHMAFRAGDFLDSHSGDLGALLTLLCRPRFAHVQILSLGGLKQVSTKLVNSAKYRKALPKPGWCRLEHLNLDNHGVLATLNCVLSLLPPSLRSLKVGDGLGRWLSPAVIDALADSCPSLEALHLGWTKVSLTSRWRDVLEAVVLRFPRLLAINIDYAGYGEGGFKVQDCLPQIAKLKRLRHLSIMHLGLDGTTPHGRLTTSESTAALEGLVAQLPELRYLSHGNNSRREQQFADAFSERITLKHPDLHARRVPGVWRTVFGLEDEWMAW